MQPLGAKESEPDAAKEAERKVIEKILLTLICPIIGLQSSNLCPISIWRAGEKEVYVFGGT
jgi:hypothetical protein